jgi:cell wall-associated NlpC family hydrolase
LRVPFAFLTGSRGRVASLVVLVATSALGVGLLPATAYAANSGSTTTAAAAAQQKLDALSIQADRAVEAYDQAQAALATVTARAAAAKQFTAKQQALVDAAKLGVQSFAVARYEGGTTSPALAVLLSRDPSKFMQQAQMLEQVSRHESASLTKLVDANRSLMASQVGADQAVATQQKALARLAASKAAVEKIISSQQVLVSKLETQAQAEQAAAAAAAARAASARQTVSRALVRAQVPSVRPVVVPARVAPARVVAAAPPAASGRASAVLAYAYAQLGKPYRFGGSGAASYDCSGLTMRAYAAAGISLAHSAAAQQHEGTRVSMSQLQPGDLIFWGSPAYHVGIYVGGGRILDAAHTGTVISVRGIWGSPSGAVRP